MSTFITPLNLKTTLTDESKVVANENTSSGIPFSDMLKDAINQTNELMEISAQDSYNLSVGNVDDLAQVQINSLKASTMLQTTVQLTTRVVNAYTDIMSMQI